MDIIAQLETKPHSEYMTTDEKREFLLHLPEYKASAPLESKRYAAEPDISFLKEQQTEAFNRLWTFIQSDAKMFLLRGVAGSGKTTVINTFAESYMARMRVVNVALTAPTNKAVKVLRNKAEYFHTNLSFITVHSFLGLKAQFDTDKEKEVFVKDYDRDDISAESCGLLIVDETSMLSPDLFNFLLPYIERGQFKVIFMGDPYQIPPVGHTESPPMSELVQRGMKIDVFDLTEIIRQGQGSPIIETTFEIRNNMDRGETLTNRVSKITDVGSVVYLDFLDGNLLDDILQKYFTSEHFKSDSDFVKVLAYRNKVVDYINARVRCYLFGENPKKIEIGEKLIADQPITDADRQEILFTTNDEMEVLDYVIKEDNFNDGKFILKYYSAKVVSVDSNKPGEKYVKILHEDSEKTYVDMLEQFAKYARLQLKGTIAFKKAWESFYQFKKKYSLVKYSYAITIHKSQGSTYNTAIVYEGDIDNNRKIGERNKIKYTACSRPSRLLIIF